MTEYTLLEAPSIFRWNGAKQGKTMFSATAGRLVLTDQRLVFVSERATDDIPLERVTRCELTGRAGNLTVHFADPTGAAAASTFGTQQFGMPAGQQWVSTILAARDASTARPSTPHPAALGDHARVWAAQHAAYQQFVAAGTGPRLRSWRLAEVVGEQTVPASSGRIEIWRDIDALPPIGYLGVVALYQPNGVLRLLLTAEVAPDLHGECYPGAFIDGAHHNIGADPAMRDPDSFARWGVGVALGYIEGPAQESSAAVPSQEEARQILRDLGERGAAHAEGMPQEELAQHLAHAQAALTALAADPRVLDALAAASRNPADPASLYTAGAGLMTIGLHEVAAPLLDLALDQGGRDPDAVNRLALCRSRTGSDADALAVFRRHPWSLGDQASRGWCAHYATMSGDLSLAREMVAGSAPAELGILGSRVQRRLARADALGRPPGGVRDWVAVLHGALLLHSAVEGEDDMNGRYAAVWDNTQRLTDVLTLLEWALVRTRRRPRRVVTWPDRDSVILGHLIRDRLGIGPHTPGDDGTTLVVRYAWSDDGGPVLEQYRDQPGAVLFAYGLDWTTGHEVTPDIVGLEAQMLTPLWDGAIRMLPDTEQGWRHESVPPDDRDATTISAELATTTATMPAYVHEDIAVLDALVAAFHRSSVPPGLLGGTREPYFAGGPVTSNRFV